MDERLQEYLNSVGYVWKPSDFNTQAVVTETLKKHIARITGLFAKNSARSVLVSGERGVGKSELINLLAKELHARNYKIFVASASDVIAGQRYIGDLQEQVKKIIAFLTDHKKSIWIIPDFIELLYAGRHEHNNSGVLDQILPYIEKNKILIIGEISPRFYEQLIRYRPKVKTAMELIRLEPTAHDETVDIGLEWTKKSKAKYIWTKTDKKLMDEVAHLCRQYTAGAEQPGNLIDFLKATEGYLEVERKNNKACTWNEFIGSMSSLTGMPLSILDDREKLDLEGLSKYFTSRVVGQNEAVNVILERIAMIKAGLTDPTRPYGVFLFVGPTGTGKTEIAKTLSQYLFGSEERMIRFDMSEFQAYGSIARIVGSTGGHEETDALVYHIRKNPFSLILLDEFEKAHQTVWDLFLQVFDDGRLTDAHGNTADFRHSIIILTSNVGAGLPVGSKIGFGNKDSDNEPDSPIQRVINEVFRPEFINRLDRIVAFRPLSRSVMRNILTNELKKILQRRGFRQKQWAVEWEDSALDFLLEKGFSDKLGARPIKRAIDKYLLAPLSITIVNNQFPSGDQFLFVKRSDNKLKVDFIDPEEPEISWKSREQKVKAQKEKAETLKLTEIAFEAHGILAERQVLEVTYKKLKDTISNFKWQQRKSAILKAMAEPDFWDRESRFADLSELEFRDRFEAGLETASSILERLQDDDKIRLNFPPDLIRRLAERLFLMVKSLDAFNNNEPQDAFIKISVDFTGNDFNYAREVEFADKLANMYQHWAKKRKMTYSVVYKTTTAERFECIIAAAGFGAYQILHSETGLHVWEVPEDDKVTRLKVKVQALAQPEIPDKSKQPKEIAMQEFEKVKKTLKIIRRYADKPMPLVKDTANEWRTGKLNKVLAGDFDLFA